MLWSEWPFEYPMLSHTARHKMENTVWFHLSEVN